MPIEKLQKSSFPNQEKSREMMEKEIRENLKLYHTTTKERWKKIQEAGGILSERELLNRGVISQDQLNDFETTSTGHLDREEGRDDYVFASHHPLNYGDVTLEIDLEALHLPGAKVSTAGEWLMFVDNETTKQYYRDNEIPASQFISYLTTFLPTLPNTRWFWEGKKNKEVYDFIGQAFKERAYNENDEKFRMFWKLYPEIIFPKELPLKYIKQAIIDEQ